MSAIVYRVFCKSVFRNNFSACSLVIRTPRLYYFIINTLGFILDHIVSRLTELGNILRVRSKCVFAFLRVELIVIF